MPELPEVETVVRTLTPSVEGRVITGCRIYNQQTVQGSIAFEKIIGCSIGKLFRRGKLVVFPLLYKGNQKYTLCIHLKMTGKLFVFSEDTDPHIHTRVSLFLDDNSKVFFDDIRKFGYMRLLSLTQLEEWSFWKELGPEPFEINAENFAEKLKKHKGMIKSLLLNQKIIAGCGNIYADESLFRAKIFPFIQTSQLTLEELQRLHRSLIEVFLESMIACGSSIKDYRTAHGDVGSFQKFFYVYGRVGQACTICDTKLEGKKLGGRMTVWCPFCQSAKI